MKTVSTSINQIEMAIRNKITENLKNTRDPYAKYLKSLFAYQIQKTVMSAMPEDAFEMIKQSTSQSITCDFKDTFGISYTLRK